jgi:uncharacterized membrane protein
MTETKNQEQDQGVYSGVYHALVIGMSTSTVLLAVGVAVTLWRNHVGHPLVVPGPVLRPAVLLAGLARFEPVSLVALATLVMILTPVARVVVSVVAFAAERDWRYTAITGAVLAAIVGTVIVGLLGG